MADHKGILVQDATSVKLDAEGGVKVWKARPGLSIGPHVRLIMGLVLGWGVFHAIRVQFGTLVPVKRLPLRMSIPLATGSAAATVFAVARSFERVE